MSTPAGRVAAAAALCALGLLATRPAPAAESAIAYGPYPGEQLDICTPAPPPSRAPAVLLIHGGGWRAGSRTSFAHLCQVFAQDGIVTIPVDYRLNTAPPATAWPIPFNDVQLALRWVRAHAAQFGIDPSRICAEGDSAGGQLALLLGVAAAIDPGDTQHLLPDISPRADCVIAISGPSDMVAMMQVHPNMVDHLVGTHDPLRARVLAHSASPALRVGPGVPAILLIHGEDDQAVPFAQATEMQEAASRVGAPVWLASHAGGHELDGLTGDERRKVWKLVEAFVQRHRLAGRPRQLSVAEALDALP